MFHAIVKIDPLKKLKLDNKQCENTLHGWIFFSINLSPESSMLHIGDKLLEVNGTPVVEHSLSQVGIFH